MWLDFRSYQTSSGEATNADSNSLVSDIPSVSIAQAMIWAVTTSSKKSLHAFINIATFDQVPKLVQSTPLHS